MEQYPGGRWTQNFHRVDEQQDHANQVRFKYFRSANTVPRELKLASNGNHMIVTSYPVKEMNALKNDKINSPEDVTVENEYRIENLLDETRGYEIELTLTPNAAEIFGFSLENTKNEKVEVKFDKQVKQITMDRRSSGLTAFKKIISLQK